jgi:dipeptidyl-peptidase 4
MDGTGYRAPTADDYTAAAALLPGNLQGLVDNESIAPIWVEGGRQFWYERRGEVGIERVLVDSRSGERVPLSAAWSNRDLDQPALSDRRLLLSPDRKHAVFVREDNLWLRDTLNGDERPLTTDGSRFDSWSKVPDSCLIAVHLQRVDIAVAPFNTTWSPDGRYLVAPKVDERSVESFSFVEAVPENGSLRPIVYDVKWSFVGDPGNLAVAYFIFDIEHNTRHQIQLPDGYAPGFFDRPVLGWSTGQKQVFLVARTRGSKSIALFKLSLKDNLITKVVEETSGTRAEANTVEYHRANFRLLGDGAQIIWYSTRLGYGHLYLYDAQTGELQHPITDGEWQVQDIHAVDEQRREIYFSATGRETGRDPYYRHLYKANFAKSGPVTLLTASDADHHFDAEPGSGAISMLLNLPNRPELIRPDIGVFIDTYSRVDTAPTTTLRSTEDGRLIATLECADASNLYAAGWQAPVRESVLAADGKTRIWATYYRPSRKVDSDKCPVIDAAYGGPQICVAPKNFKEAYGARNPLGPAALARLGFAVVVVDARGTPGRSNAFRDAGYPEFTRVGVEDHAIAIRQLAERHPEMDIERTGVYGWSWGGSFAAQAILTNPDFYGVAVSGGGIYDYASLYSAYDCFVGVPIYADGGTVRPTPADSPDNWCSLDITRMADRLTGHLLIIYADLDENVPSHQALRLVSALTRANKPYDLLCLPSRTHAGVHEGYSIKRTWDYFVEHLLGCDPVFDVRVESRPALAL